MPPAPPKGVLRNPDALNLASSSVVVPGDRAKITFTVLNSSTRTFAVLSDLNTGRPTLTGGGSRWNVIPRPGRTGLTVFDGYDPLQIQVPILFDNFIDGSTIQDDVDLLWLMWGRGPGAANTTADHKASPVLSVTGNLMPPITQASATNPGPPNWVITQIDEDGASAVFNSAQHLVRLAVTVSLQEFIASSALGSLADSKPSGSKTNVYPKDTTMRKVATLQQTTVAALRTLNNYGHNKTLDKYLRDPSKKFAKHLSVKVPRIDA